MGGLSVTSIIFTFLGGFGTLVYLVGTWLAHRRQAAKPKVAITKADLAVTVMKPMSGNDPRLRENLESFAKLEGAPTFEVLLCLASEKDAAYPLAKEFADRYPERFKLNTGAHPSLGNAKMAQLWHAYPRVQNDLVWVSESNVETDQAFLESLVIAWKEENAVKRVPTFVHAPLVAVHGEGFGASLERMQLATMQNASHEVSLWIGVHAVVGKSEFFHRADFEALGGFEAFGNYLGEDFMLGRAFQKAGVVRCASQATRNVIGKLPVKGWFDRHARWAVMRKTLIPWGFFFAEPLTYSMVPVLLAAFGLISPWLAVGAVVTRVLIDLANFSIASREAPRLLDVVAAPVKEVLTFVLWVMAIFTFHVKWRADKAIQLGANSVVLSKSADPSKLRRTIAALTHK